VRDRRTDIRADRRLCIVCAMHTSVRPLSVKMALICNSGLGVRDRVRDRVRVMVRIRVSVLSLKR